MKFSVNMSGVKLRYSLFPLLESLEEETPSEIKKKKLDPLDFRAHVQEFRLVWLEVNE